MTILINDIVMSLFWLPIEKSSQYFNELVGIIVSVV